MKIKKWLIAGKHNHYHPHLLRPVGLSIVVALLLGINLMQNITQAHTFQVLGYASSIDASEVISISNQKRADSGLPALKYNSKLTSAAKAKAQDMFAKNYWAHYAPDGTSPWSFITASGYKYTTAGENLAKNFDTSAGVVSGWMNSSGHRANILSSSFVDTGVAVMNGTLQGSQTTLVVAFYAAPKASSPAPTPAPTKPKSASSSSSSSSSPPTTQPKSTAEPTTQTTTAKKDPKPVEKTQPVATQQPKITKLADVEPVADAAARSIDAQEVALKQNRTWSQNATLFILSTVFLVSVFKHTVVWRTKRQGWRHIWLRAHPAAQYGLLLVAISANLASSVGVIR
jgi:hypothetical protein